MTKNPDNGPYAKPAINAGISSKWIFKNGGKNGSWKLRKGTIYKIMEIAAKMAVLVRNLLEKRLELLFFLINKNKIANMIAAIAKITLNVI